MKHVLFAIGVFSLSFMFKHDFHVSITDIQLKQDTFQIAIKLFTHDLEEELKASTGNTIFLDQSTDMTKAFKVIKSYCEPRFSVANASKDYPLEWIGHEYEDDVCWVYAFAKKDPKSNMLFVRNSLLDGDHHDQHNMIHLSANGKVSSKIATRDKPEVRFIIGT